MAFNVNETDALKMGEDARAQLESMLTSENVGDVLEGKVAPDNADKKEIIFDQENDKNSDKSTTEEDPLDQKTATDDVSTEKKLKEQKRNYLSTISKLKKELADKERLLQEKKGDTEYEGFDVVESLVEKKIAEREIALTEIQEERDFIRENPDFANKFDKIKEIKDEIPGISWETAKKLYLVDNPEPVKPTSNLGISGGLPKSVSNPNPTDADIEKMAREEAMKLFGQNI